MAFGDHKVISPPLTALLFHVGVLRTGFLIFNKNLLDALYAVLDSLRY